MDKLTPRDAARILRSNQTPAEERLWSDLRRRQLDGLRFRRQRRFGRFIVDFYCPEVRLAIEVDGGVHDAEGQRAHDADRDAALRSIGVYMLRVTNEDVFQRPDSVLQRIREAAVEARSHATR